MLMVKNEQSTQMHKEEKLINYLPITKSVIIKHPLYCFVTLCVFIKSWLFVTCKYFSFADVLDLQSNGNAIKSYSLRNWPVASTLF